MYSSLGFEALPGFTGSDKWPTASRAAAKMWHYCPCVSTLLPSSFTLGRHVSILWLETGCRQATGLPLSGGKISGNLTLFSYVLSIDHFAQSTPVTWWWLAHHILKGITDASQFIPSFFLFAWHATLYPPLYLFCAFMSNLWFIFYHIRYEVLITLIHNEPGYHKWHSWWAGSREVCLSFYSLN